MFKPPVIFTTFCGAGASNAYVAVADTVKLMSVLDAKLQEFNESNAMMDLVLFDQAMVRYVHQPNDAGVVVHGCNRKGDTLASSVFISAHLFILFALFFWFPISDPGSHSRRSSPLPIAVHGFIQSRV